MMDWMPQLQLGGSGRPWMIHDNKLYVGEPDTHHTQWGDTALIHGEYNRNVPLGKVWPDGEVEGYYGMGIMELPTVRKYWQNAVRNGGVLPLEGLQEVTGGSYAPRNANQDWQPLPPRKADVGGYANWDTWHTALLIDNERETQDEAHRIVQTGLENHQNEAVTTQQLADWALRVVVGPHNQQAIKDAQEWNDIPPEERIDYSFEDLKNRNEQAADIVNQLGFGPDVSDTDPMIMEDHLINWHEIYESIKDEILENWRYEQGLPWRSEELPEWWPQEPMNQNQNPDSGSSGLTIPNEWISKRQASDDWLADSADSWHGPGSVREFKVDVPGEAPGMPRNMETGGFRSPCWCDCGQTMPHEWSPMCENGLHPTLEHEASRKTGMAFDPQSWEHVKNWTPMLWHATEAENLPSIMKIGLWPASAVGNPRDQGFWQPRPGHVYLFADKDHAMESGRYQDLKNPVLVGVHTHMLDPKALKADEDFLYSNSWMPNDYFADDDEDEDEDDEWRHDYGYGEPPLAQHDLHRPSLGEWAQEHGLDSPVVTWDSYARHNTLAHEGPIPPHAIAQVYPDDRDVSRRPQPTVAPNQLQIETSSNGAEPWAHLHPPDNSNYWVWLDGHVAFGGDHHDIADRLTKQIGYDPNHATYIGNMIARGLQPEGHNVAVGTLKGGTLPQIFFSTIDRNAVYDDVARARDERMQKVHDPEGLEDHTASGDEDWNPYGSFSPGTWYKWAYNPEYGALVWPLEGNNADGNVQDMQAGRSHIDYMNTRWDRVHPDGSRRYPFFSGDTTGVIFHDPETNTAHVTQYPSRSPRGNGSVNPMAFPHIEGEFRKRIPDAQISWPTEPSFNARVQ